MHRLMIDKIVAEGTKEQMEELRELLVCLIDELRLTDYEAYVAAEKTLHEIVWDHHIGEPLACKWAKKFKNKDGSCGAHWTVEQTTQVAKDRSITCDKWDWYIVLNMVYSDYYNAKFDISTYVDLAKDWLGDKDVDKDKLVNYYYYVVCGK